ncbi:NAD-P-binding protein [Fomes fomentarius]|nr:NAD-P-binding protein [Fomes fomentarius]
MGGTTSKNSLFLGQFLTQSYPPKSKFSVDQIPDLTGHIIIVTGGNVGIGYEIIKALLEHNAKVYLAARSKERAEGAIASLKEVTGKEAIFLELDLSSLASVKKAVTEFLSKEHELHVLFNNAGVLRPPSDQFTSEGIDLQWGVNVVGHWYLTELLTPALLAGVESSPDHYARVISTSSITAYWTTIDLDTFKDTPARLKKYKEGNNQGLYWQSKLGAAIIARQVAKRYADKGIISIAVNPGNIRSELQRNHAKMYRKILELILLYPTSYGALTPLYAGTSPEALNYNGEYLIPWARAGKLRSEMYDDELGERLWGWLEEQTKNIEDSQ